MTQLQQIIGSDLASSIDPYSLVAMLVFSFIGIVYYRKGKRENDILILTPIQVPSATFYS